MTATSPQLTAPQASAAPHLSEDLLTPRFYTTEIAKAARTDLDAERPAFEAMLGEMEADYNRDHFDRKAPLDRVRDLAPEQKEAYESYLVRSCVSEFSGFLLFKELSRQLKLAKRPELSRLFNLMARDEARHAGFLNRALVAEGIVIDLPSLSGKRPVTWFPLNWVLYSVYLSEKIGYWRYILIDRHLKANPENAFAPLFDFFEPWCQDENRHGDIFNMLIRCWPGLNSGLRGRLLSRFFLWSVFLTHSLTVCERGNFYRLLGMDPDRFDAEVMRQTNRTARRAFPVVYQLTPTYFELRDQLVDTFRGMKACQAQPMRQLGLKLHFASLLLRQFLQPMERSDAPLAEVSA
ncbi:magnesium-protoporphyrin IX monomethyl ester (oxidative) cyclase [Vulcanococcus sp. Clear-D1]|uniref:magnesium-protoporphyrin IX monomethyl ester (oxidative) cyclase n=1 Tax=Vulcanococcus sp. Clear-D1 TaxID=2766970 RepID=UPI0019BDB26C|nr:magnesium-protoporphyrin IX monomethyl ester (oxidative) cyclase [Vulcanococcus sp. Clear-D1]MBD1192586.1 magnesium-protoporphyrin IX monomethyl ester (oxidative) cyclase [Vulcanococcus sp. Clear-D1]